MRYLAALALLGLIVTDVGLRADEPKPPESATLTGAWVSWQRVSEIYDFGDFQALPTQSTFIVLPPSLFVQAGDCLEIKGSVSCAQTGDTFNCTRHPDEMSKVAPWMCGL